MTWDHKGLTISTLVADADYSAADGLDGSGKYRFFHKNTTANQLTRSGANQRFIEGVGYNNPAAGQAVNLAVDGAVVAECSAAIAEGANITSAANGRAVTAATGEFVFGRALAATTAAGQLVPFVFGFRGTAP